MPNEGNTVGVVLYGICTALIVGERQRLRLDFPSICRLFHLCFDLEFLNQFQLFRQISKSKIVCIAGNDAVDRVLVLHHEPSNVFIDIALSGPSIDSASVLSQSAFQKLEISGSRESIAFS